MSRRPFTPPWREDVPGTGTYRSIFKYSQDQFKHPSAGWVEMFRTEFGMTEADYRKSRPSGDAKAVAPRPVELAAEHLEAFRGMVGPNNVATDDFSRVKFGHGKSLDENLDLRKGIVHHVPDAVLHPRDKEDVRKIVAYCHANDISLVTYGGGSGVVLGNRADRGGVALVLRTHMNRLLRIDEKNQTAIVEPGMMGPDYEAALNQAPARFGTKHAFTCGHFPQSFEISSVGGWVAALGSGQASSYYGDAYDLVIAQEYVTPAGTIRTHEVPATATGPKLNDLLKGNEGAFGVLVEVTMRIYRHMPENRQRFAYMFPTWEAAVEASREIFQAEFGNPAVFRISDPEETEIGLKLKGQDGIPAKVLELLGYAPMKRCLCIGTAEGHASYTKNVKEQVARIAKEHGALSLTGYATKLWEHGRYSDIHMRDDLLDHGIVLDTLETGVSWENLHRLHEGVRAFVKERPHTICLTHASHFYAQGTNLYFIFLMRPADEAEFFRFRSGVVSKIVELGGSISHHHGVGRLFAPWMRRYLGDEQLGALRALKRYFDPKNLMNPGVLALPEESTLPAGGSSL